MDPTVIFWILLILLILYSHITFRWNQIQRYNCIKRLEKERKTRVIVMVHRQEQLALFGIPIYRFITIEDSEEVLRAIRMTPEDMPIDLILHTPGGLVLASEQIAMALKEHRAKTTVIVPHYAMSGGTLIALAADEIIMDKNAYKPADLSFSSLLNSECIILIMLSSEDTSLDFPSSLALLSIYLIKLSLSILLLIKCLFLHL